MCLRNWLQVGIWSVTCLAGSVSAHTMFLKPGSAVAEPGETIDVFVINGTFLESENRIRKASARSSGVYGPDGKELEFADRSWERDGKMSILRATLAEPGNYIIGLSNYPQKVTLDGDEFNYYLRYEGLLDQIDEREDLGESGTEVVEEYQKFAKALVQAGAQQSDNFAQELGHEVEIVPITNPYTLGVGDVFRARVLRDGEPLQNMRVFATHEGHLPVDDEGIYDEAVKVQSDADGVIEFEITATGKWYVRFIDLRRVSDSEYWYSGMLASVGADEKRIVYESKWATLTFEIR